MTSSMQNAQRTVNEGRCDAMRWTRLQAKPHPMQCMSGVGVRMIYHDTGNTIHFLLLADL